MSYHRPRPIAAVVLAAYSLAFAGLALSACARTSPPPQTPSPAAAPDSAGPAAPEAPTATPKRRVIVMVWDGLRPDSIDPEITPQLAALRDTRGVNFQDHHSVYPTFTMMNAAAFATGARSGLHGFYGNTLYQPGPKGHNAKGAEIDFSQPVFSEDHAILQALDEFYRAQGKALLQTPTLFELARAAGLTTAVLGKSGPAFLQDYRGGDAHSVIVDESVVFPRAFALQLQAAGIPLPKNIASQSYPEGPITLAADNGDPTGVAHDAVITLEDHKTSDPRASGGSPHNSRNAYMMRVLTEYILPKLDPSLTLIWLRNPDSTQHTYGPGTPNVIDALRHQDQLLGELLASLQTLGRMQSTNLLIVSDHGHSSVGADDRRFPTRALLGEPDGHAKVGERAQPGFIVSGEVRTVDWLRRAGFAHSYDGAACLWNPVLSGIKADGQPASPPRHDPQCSPPEHTTPSYPVPSTLPADAVIVAANGGSEYFYLPSHDAQLLQRLTTALQERDAYGPIFVRSVYGALPGTLPLSSVGLEGPSSVSPPTPDLVVSFAWNADATSAAGPSAPGTELSSAYGNRGMHGSFSPRDVHNTLIAAGPHFRAGMTDTYPTSNLDVAPTVATLLGLGLPSSEGRVLYEAMEGTREQIEVQAFDEQTEPVQLRRVCSQDDLDCKRPQPTARYVIRLRGRTLQTRGSEQRLRYLDQAEATRLP